MSPPSPSQQARRTFYGLLLGLLVGLVIASAQWLGWLQKLEIVGLDILYNLRGEPPKVAVGFVRVPEPASPAERPDGAGQAGKAPPVQGPKHRLAVEYDLGKLLVENEERDRKGLPKKELVKTEPVLHPRIRVVGIDQDTKRQDYAKLVDILGQVGTKLVAFDVIFSRKDEKVDPVVELREAGAPAGIIKLAQELSDSGKPTYEMIDRLREAGAAEETLAVFRAASEEGKTYGTLKLIQALKQAGNVLLPVFQPFTPKVVDLSQVRKTTWPFVQAYQLEQNEPEIAAAALAIGHFNVELEQGMAFCLPFGVMAPTKQREKYVQLGLLAGLAARSSGSVFDSRFAEEAGRQFADAGFLDSRGRFFPRLAAPPVIRIKEFFGWFEEKPEEVSAFFRDTIVFVGHTTKGGRVTDQVPSPFGPWFGLYYHVSAAYSVLENGFWRPQLEHGAFPVLSVLVSVLLGFAASRSKAWLAILIGLGVLFGYWGLCVVMAFGVFGSPALWPTACFSLTAVANLLGVFVARSDLAERLLRRREREIEILQDEDPESSERVDVRRVGRQIASTVHGESLKADWCIVRERLRGAEGEEIRAERYGACEHEAVVDVERQLSDQVFRDGQALLVPNVPRQFPKCSAALCPSAMAVPLTDGQEVIGSVVVGGKLREKFRGQPRYQVEDLQFMRALAREWSSRAVIAQYNRTLEDRVQKRTLDLQMANDRLRELDRQKSDFMNMVAHDLRTPLTSIRSYAEIMLTYKDEPPETYNEFLSVINDESVRLNSLIDNFLDLARIEAGSFRLEIVPTDLGKLIGHAVAVFRGHAEPKGIDLTAEVPPDLPKALCDGDRVAQVLANLLSNALKFTPEGGKVSIRAERFEAPESPGQPMVEVCVADTGPGIPKHAQEGIFEKFRQVETSDEKVKKIQRAGTGLGLPLCREFVEKHKGKIWVESDPGKGSRFHFTLFSEGSNMLEILQDRQANGQTALADGRQPG